MSFAIPIEKVYEVLLTDGWHKVEQKSFRVDSYEYTDGRRVIVGGHVVPTTGASWREVSGEQVACPLTAILAVRLTA
jgi:predicted RNA binding protein YcfA (HicA-like mRNA interferase family)